MSAPTVLCQNAGLLRFTIAILPTLLIAIGIHFYLLNDAERFEPPTGYAFPREPILKGEYRYEVLKGRRNRRTVVGDTEVVCSTFSYFAATWAQSDGYSNCGRKELLHGRQVEVHRVRVPVKNPAAGPLVIRIVSEGRVYLDISDKEVRDLWIRDTARDASGGGVMLLTIAVGCMSWGISSYVVRRLNDRRKK